MGTRYVHQVRCKKGAGTDTVDDQTFVDVEVTDAISFIGPNGQQMVIDFSKLAGQAPYIIDDVGAGNGTGDPDSATRQSHMEQISSPDDNTISLYIEVLDICSFLSPNGKRGILHMPGASCGYHVDDQASLGISDTTSDDGNQTRRGHTIKVTAKTNSDPQGENTDFLGVLTTDAISYRGVNGQQEILDMSAYDVEDTTQYTQDDQGNNVPPDNTDPNTYVKFPDASNSPWVKIGDGSTGPQIGCAMGPLWRIVNADGNNGPWWIYTPEYQPVQWSTVAFDGCIGSDYFDERCFPYCEAPCSCGCDSFYTDYYPSTIGITFHRWPCVGHFAWVPCGGTDPGPTGTLPVNGFSTANIAAKYAQDTDPSACVKLNFTTEPQDRFGPGTITAGYGGWQPNVWQIVGEPYTSQQPHHTDHDTGKEIYDAPSSALAKKVAQLFLKQWNDTSDAYNAGELAMDGSHGGPCCEWRDGSGAPYSVDLGPFYPSYTADWKFGCDVVEGPTTTLPGDHRIGNWFYPSNTQDFAGGLPPAGWWGGMTSYPCGVNAYIWWAFHPAYATPIGIVQLDPKVWDTSGNTPKLKDRPPGLAPDAPWPP